MRQLWLHVVLSWVGVGLVSYALPIRAVAQESAVETTADSQVLGEAGQVDPADDGDPLDPRDVERVRNAADHAFERLVATMDVESLYDELFAKDFIAHLREVLAEDVEEGEGEGPIDDETLRRFHGAAVNLQLVRSLCILTLVDLEGDKALDPDAGITRAEIDEAEDAFNAIEPEDGERAGETMELCIRECSRVGDLYWSLLSRAGKTDTYERNMARLVKEETIEVERDSDFGGSVWIASRGFLLFLFVEEDGALKLIAVGTVLDD